MRKVLYRVAASVDGYITGPRGEIDWITGTPASEISALYDGVDTVLLGRRSYELTRQPGAPAWPAGWRIYVFSRTLALNQPAGITVVDSDPTTTVSALRAETGKGIWLFGGGSLFRTLVTARLVDVVEVAVIPVVLGGGVPLLEHGAPRTRLELIHAKSHPSGVVTLRYQVPDAIS
jgi:dihydrofolate reductase